MQPINDRLHYDIFCLVAYNLDLSSCSNFARACKRVADYLKNGDFWKCWALRIHPDLSKDTCWKDFLQKNAPQGLKLDDVYVVINPWTQKIEFSGKISRDELPIKAVEKVSKWVNGPFTMCFNASHADYYYYRGSNEDKLNCALMLHKCYVIFHQPGEVEDYNEYLKCQETSGINDYTARVIT